MRYDYYETRARTNDRLDQKRLAKQQKEREARERLAKAAPALLVGCKLLLGHKPLDVVAHLLNLNYKDVLKAQAAVEQATKL